MAKDFSAPHCNSARAGPIQRHRDKEMIVGRRERHHPQQREIHVTFEPSRLSLAWIAQAYEQVVPIVRRTTSRPARRHGEDAEALQGRSPQGTAPFIGESQSHG
jgi:hypothetical protein